MESARMPESPPESRLGTRDLLLQILKRGGECDAAGLAEELGISGVAVRQHLNVLVRDGLVTHRLERRPIGRPVHLHRLTSTAEQHFPQSSDAVAMDLLSRVEEQQGTQAINSALEKRMADMEAHYREKLVGLRSWKQKLERLAEVRDSEGFFCDVEPAAKVRGGVRLVNRHCPLADIAEQYPQLCSYELELFKRVLGEPGIKRTEHIRSGGHACRYELPRKKSGA